MFSNDNYFYQLYDGDDNIICCDSPEGFGKRMTNVPKPTMLQIKNEDPWSLQYWVLTGT